MPYTRLCRARTSRDIVDLLRALPDVALLCLPWRSKSNIPNVDHIQQLAARINMATHCVVDLTHKRDLHLFIPIMLTSIYDSQPGNQLL